MDLQKKMNNINVEVIRDLSKDDYQEVADSYFNNIMQARQLVRNIQNNSGGQDKRQKDKVAQWSGEIETANDLLNNKRNEFGGSAPPNYSQSSSNNQGSFDDKDLQVLSIQNNEAVMRKRKEDLIAIKQAANQVKDLTEVMKTDIHEQADNIASVENNVLEVVDQTDKANKEMIKANELSKKNQKKMCCFIFIVIFVAAILIGLILYMTGVFNKQ